MKKIILILGLIFTFAGAALAVLVPRWNLMPLNVYIENGPKAAIVQSAFSAWQSSSGNIVRFKFPTGDIWTKRSQLIVTFADQANGDEPGSAAMQVNIGGFFMHGDITIPLRDKEGNPYSDEKLYAASLHVIGHALGIQHTMDPKDIMYKTLTNQTSLTEGDINALKNVYLLQRPGTNPTVIIE